MKPILLLCSLVAMLSANAASYKALIVDGLRPQDDPGRLLNRLRRAMLQLLCSQS